MTCVADLLPAGTPLADCSRCARETALWPRTGRCVECGTQLARGVRGNYGAGRKPRGRALAALETLAPLDSDLIAHAVESLGSLAALDSIDARSRIVDVPAVRELIRDDPSMRIVALAVVVDAFTSRIRTGGEDDR